MTKRKETSREPLALIYVRVSTLKQEAEGLSLEAQERTLTARAIAEGFRVEVIRESKSGKKLSNRPQLKAALERLSKGEAQALYVAKLDRLARSLSDLLSIVEQANRKEWRLSIGDIGLDTSTPQGRLVLNLLGSVAEFERRLISERAKDTHRERAARGEVWGVTKGSRSLLPREVRTRIVSERVEGLTLTAIAEGLNRDRVPTIKGGSKWYASTVKHFLDSPATRKAA